MKRHRFLRKPAISIEWGNTRKALHAVSGLSIEIEVVKVREGGDMDHIHKAPGKHKYPNVVIAHNITKSDLDFYNWIHAINSNHVDKRHVRIQVADKNNKEVRTWKLYNAWPCKFYSPELNVNTIAMEIVELAHEGLEIIF